jgi:RAD54-like protein 2
LEKKIYDRQIGKQGTADRVVDELNPEARLSLRDVTSLVCDDEEDPPPKDYGVNRNPHLSLTDPILENVLKNWGSSFTKDPFQHEALLAESKESKLSKAEYRMAQRLYEKAKMDGNTQYRRSNSYSSYYPKMPLPIPTMSSSSSPGYYNRTSPYPTSARPSGIPSKPILNPSLPGLGMDLLEEALAQGKLVCKEMLLSKDVTIARNQLTGGGNADGSPVVLPAGTRVKLIKTPKGIYMQTPEGKIFRIHSSTPATTPTSPSTMAAALGMSSRSSFSQSTSGLQSSYGYGSDKSLIDETMMRKFKGREKELKIIDNMFQTNTSFIFRDAKQDFRCRWWETSDIFQ